MLSNQHLCYTVGCSQWSCSYFICFVSIWLCSLCLSFAVLLSHPIFMNTCICMQTCIHARPHTKTINMITYCIHTHHWTHQCFFSYVRLVSSLYLFISTLSLAHNQHAPRNRHRQVKHTQAHTHKVARLVGAMAAAPLRSPRVAPGARLPVVCQRLRVEFIQIKAVEWGPSPRMPRPSPSSAFRRWE